MKVQVFSRLEELVQLEAAWQAFDQRYPPETLYQECRFLMCWFHHLPEGKKPYIVTIWKEDELQCIAPLVIAPIGMGPLKFFRICLATVRPHSPTLDIRINPNNAEAIIDRLLLYLERDGPRWSWWDLRHISSSGFFAQHAVHVARKYRYLCVTEEARPESYLEITQSWDDYYSGLSRECRKVVRRCFREVDSADCWSYRHQWVRSDELGDTLADYRSTVALSWKKNELDDKGYFSMNDSLCAEYAKTGDLLISCVGTDESSAGVLMCFRSELGLFAYHMAYDESSDLPYGIGTGLLASAMKFAMDEGIPLFDFSTAAGHIHRWKPDIRITKNVHLFKRSVSGMLLYALQNRKLLRKARLHNAQ